jgi:hypothetical protein
MKDRDNVQQRMTEIMELIDSSIQLTDDREELIMLACAMLQRTVEILDDTIGEQGRDIILKGSLNEQG